MLTKMKGKWRKGKTDNAGDWGVRGSVFKWQEEIEFGVKVERPALDGGTDIYRNTGKNEYISTGKEVDKV